MDVLDLLILIAGAMAAVGGYRLGFLGRAVSWIGQAIGLLAGAQLHRTLPPGPLRMIDRLVGGVIGAAGVIALLWLLIPPLASIAGWPSQAVTRSAISRLVARDLPRPPSVFRLLQRVIGEGNPQVFAILAPSLDAGPPPANVPLSASVVQSVVRSTVKVQGTACDEIIDGSGFAVAPNLIVTNAHVVAGEKPGNTSVLLPNGQTLPANVVTFDPNRDIALLSVPGLGESPLPVVGPQEGQLGAAFGHPEGVDQVQAVPARVALVATQNTYNIYLTHSYPRAIVTLAAALQHGDSGGPVVDSLGQVIGVAFAIANDRPNTSYADNTSELSAVMAEPRVSDTPTGSCLTSG